MRDEGVTGGSRGPEWLGRSLAIFGLLFVCWQVLDTCGQAFHEPRPPQIENATSEPLIVWGVGFGGEEFGMGRINPGDRFGVMDDGCNDDRIVVRTEAGELVGQPPEPFCHPDVWTVTPKDLPGGAASDG